MRSLCSIGVANQLNINDEKALDAKDAIDDLNLSLSELYKQRFDTLTEEFDLYVTQIQLRSDALEELISQEEANGHIVSKNFYTTLQNNAHAEAEMLREERRRLIAERDNMVNSGAMEIASAEWYAINNQIDEITNSIYECQTAWGEYGKAIRETEWKVFDIMQDRISDIADESQFLIDLMSNEKLYDDRGQLTDKGMATMGLHGVNYNTYMGQADMYAEEIKKIQAEIEKDPLNQDIIDRYYELVDAQREAILAAEDEKNAIKDMVEEGIQLELDALDELIQKYKDSLQAQKDLYDYENEIAEKTDNIAVLEKQLSAFRGDDSEESQAKIQQIMDELEDAQKDLADAEYNRYISDTERLLDQMYTEYETILNQRLDNIDALIMDMIAEINSNAGMIGDVISSEANNVGYTLSDSMNQIWSNENAVLTYYGDGFLNSMTNVVTVLNGIKVNIQSMVSKLDALAQQKIEEVNNSSAHNTPVTKPSTPNTPTPPTNNNTQQTPSKTVTVGGQINAGNATIYATAWGQGGGRQYYASDPIYTVLQKKNGYVLTRWHKLSSGYTGWFKESDVKALKVGARRIDDDQYAWTQEEGPEMIVRPSDGAILTPLAKNDSVLTADATRNIWDMANNPTKFIKDNFGTNAPDAPAVTGGNTTYTQNLESVVFSLPNVKNYEQLLASMQKDKNFERLISSMTLDKLAGKNSLAKGKALR